MLNYYCSTLSIVRKGTKHIAYNVFNRINNIQNPIFYKYMKNFSHTEISYMKGRYYNFMTQLINI